MNVLKKTNTFMNLFFSFVFFEQKVPPADLAKFKFSYFH